MGKRGPIPKREDQRRRRNTESKADSVPFDGTPVAAPPADGEWHKIARANDIRDPSRLRVGQVLKLP